MITASNPHYSQMRRKQYKKCSSPSSKGFLNQRFAEIEPLFERFIELFIEQRGITFYPLIFFNFQKLQNF